jgi:hypothetical protein
LYALEIRRGHRVLHDLGSEMLRQIPLVPDGARLSRRAEYLDPHDPARSDFRALGDEIVRPGQRLVARSDVTAEAWRELLEASDRGRWAPFPTALGMKTSGPVSRAARGLRYRRRFRSGCCRCC